MVAADNVGQALSLASRLVTLRQQIISISVEVSEERCSIIMREKFDLMDVSPFVHDMLIATLANVA